MEGAAGGVIQDPGSLQACQSSPIPSPSPDVAAGEVRHDRGQVRDPLVARPAATCASPDGRSE